MLRLPGWGEYRADKLGEPGGLRNVWLEVSIVTDFDTRRQSNCCWGIRFAKEIPLKVSDEQEILSQDGLREPTS